MASFWEILPVSLSVVQMGLYISGFSKYKGRLDDLSDDLRDRAEERYEKYKELRLRDQEFFDYYDNLPNYLECESNIKRSKGSAFAAYGRDMRRSMKVVRGYSQMNKVHLASRLAEQAVHDSSMHRAVTKINERAHVDDHVLERWNALVRAPVDIEGSSTLSVASTINASFSTLKTFGQGFNSAGAMFGTSLNRILN